MNTHTFTRIYVKEKGQHLYAIVKQNFFQLGSYERDPHAKTQQDHTLSSSTKEGDTSFLTTMMMTAVNNRSFISLLFDSQLPEKMFNS